MTRTPDGRAANCGRPRATGPPSILRGLTHRRRGLRVRRPRRDRVPSLSSFNCALTRSPIKTPAPRLAIGRFRLSRGVGSRWFWRNSTSLRIPRDAVGRKMGSGRVPNDEVAPKNRNPLVGGEHDIEGIDIAVMYGAGERYRRANISNGSAIWRSTPTRSPQSMSSRSSGRTISSCRPTTRIRTGPFPRR